MNEAHDYSLCYIVTLVLKGGICLFIMWQIHLLIPRCYRFPERGLNRQNDRKKYVDICLICQEVNAFHKFEVDLSSVERGVRVDTPPPPSVIPTNPDKSTTMNHVAGAGIYGGRHN